MIIIKNLSHSIGGDTLFKSVSTTIHQNDRIGIVGQNGSGKTTLLKLLISDLVPDTGSIKVEQERIGYLPQGLVFSDGETIASYIREVPQSKKDGVLKEVGLAKVPADTPVTSLSGGQKRRLALARVLGNGPTLLLLDEPTNHLDKDAILWLETLIQNFRGGVIIVSHDRSMLDNTVNKIFEIIPERETIEVYTGNYTAYLLEKKKRDDLQNEAHRLQQREKKRLEAWIARKREEAKIYDEASIGKQIRARERYLEREILDKPILKAGPAKKIRGADIEGSVANTKLVCRFTDVVKNYGDTEVLKGVSFELRGKERVLIVGQNGSGKTTLLKMLVGLETADSGAVRVGESIRVGYFAQEQELLSLENSVLDEFLDTPNLVDPKNARAILGSFLFHGQDVFKQVKFLSLGERVRLVFAKLTNVRNEFLVLDEPTNHLDISSREVIEDALMEYEGAILAISHDRYFVDKIGFDRILELKKGIIASEKLRA